MGFNKKQILEAVDRELENARRKFSFWPEDKIHAAAICAEEAGELVRATLKYTYEQGSLEECNKEAMQMIAMGFRFLTQE